MVVLRATRERMGGRKSTLGLESRDTSWNLGNLGKSWNLMRPFRIPICLFIKET